MECMKNFTAGVIQVFGDKYKRQPTQVDVDRLLQVAETHDFPGMLGSIDCIYWEWKNHRLWKKYSQKGFIESPPW